MNSIVLATDGSPSAEKATRFAIELARETGARLCVSAVWHTPVTNYPYDPMTAIPEIEEAEKKQAANAAATAAELAEAEGVDAESLVREGDPVEVISQTATDVLASLVVVGSHGWGPLRRLVFGSVSTGLLHHAPCPVLVVRADPDALSLGTGESKQAAVPNRFEKEV